jgi:DNA repair protein RadC
MKTYKSTVDFVSLRKQKSDIKRARITCSEDAANYIRQFYFDDLDICESFFLLLLSIRNSTIGYAKISQGGVTGTVVDVKIIAKYIADTMAKGIVVAHNHPSGVVNPSKKDFEVTQKIKEVAMIFDSVLVDHIILAEDSYYSFADESNI